MAGWRGSYGSRVKAAETRREAFLAGITPEEEHQATIAHFVSEGTAQRYADHLGKSGRPGYKAAPCDHCGDGYRIVK